MGFLGVGGGGAIGLAHSFGDELGDGHPAGMAFADAVKQPHVVRRQGGGRPGVVRHRTPWVGDWGRLYVRQIIMPGDGGGLSGRELTGWITCWCAGQGGGRNHGIMPWKGGVLRGSRWD